MTWSLTLVVNERRLAFPGFPDECAALDCGEGLREAIVAIAPSATVRVLAHEVHVRGRREWHGGRFGNRYRRSY